MVTPDLVLVLNCGSSSIKFAILNPSSGTLFVNGLAERLKTDQANLTFKLKKENGETEKIELALGNADHTAALNKILNLLEEKTDLAPRIAVVGHRVLHGGQQFVASVRVDEEVEAAIDRFAVLGPLHNPANLLGIRAAKQAFKNLPQVAVFDTAFHQTMPDYASTYALPYELTQKHGIRKYGFHGTSHRYVSQQALRYLNLTNRDSAIVVAHLGNGCSLSAVKNGESVDTSMGLTPLEGLMMGTRTGDLDPSLPLYLMRTLGMSLDEVDDILNRQSGLLGVSGVSSDMRSVREASNLGSERATLALEMFSYRIAKYIASYLAPLGHLDALVFTGGIGENAPLVRDEIAKWLTFVDIKLDEQLNRENGQNSGGIVSPAGHLPIVMVIPTNEELMIAQDAWRLIQVD